MIKSELLELWTDKERKEGRRITIEEVARATGLARNTISGFLSGETTRFDSGAVGKLCQYFNIDEGQPVPFLKVRYIEAQ